MVRPSQVESTITSHAALFIQCVLTPKLCISEDNNFHCQGISNLKKVLINFNNKLFNNYILNSTLLYNDLSIRVVTYTLRLIAQGCVRGSNDQIKASHKGRDLQIHTQIPISYNVDKTIYTLLKEFYLHCEISGSNVLCGENVVKCNSRNIEACSNRVVQVLV